MDTRALLRYVLNPWVVGGAVLVGVLLLCGTILLLLSTRPGPGAAVPATAIVNVILQPSATPVPPTATPAPPQTPNSPASPGQGSVNFALGEFVQVTGTGGDGLRLRADPGLNGVVRFLGLESEVFQVKDGPRQVDDYTWWFLVAPYDASIQGWAVGNFLVPAQNPE